MDLKFIIFIFISIFIIRVESLNACEELKKQICSSCNNENYQCTTNKNGEVDMLQVNNQEFSSGIPDVIFNTTSISSLYLMHNRISELPDNIDNLKNLKKLDIRNNNLKIVPSTIGNLYNLKYLKLSNNPIMELPEEIGNLKELKLINLNNCKLEKLPSSIAKLSNLQELTLENNKLKSISKEIGNLKNLKKLILDNNNIAELPTTLNGKDFVSIKNNNNKKFLFKKKIQPFYTDKDGISYTAKTNGRYLSIYDGDSFKDIYIQGVNMGLGAPNYFPGEVGISYDQYYDWFNQIADMNSNTIRVYTIQPSEFYEAFYNYNTNHTDKPLYFFQGTWYDESRWMETQDVFDPELLSILYQDTRDLIDIIHGNAALPNQQGKASGTYSFDVSPWCIGWILGVESDEKLVTTTNENNINTTSYKGKYISANNLQPFEVFWGMTADYTITYEMDNYKTQRPLSFSNWLTADTMKHPSETMLKEDSITLDVQRLTKEDTFKCGFFASYHVYPYYPNFMWTQKNYIEHKDAKGNINPYEAYLQDLISTHSSDIPLLVAEVGIPTSRGVTHINPITGFNQGKVDEISQGKMLISMAKDIKANNYAGCLIFSWQDEWFKRTWNTMDNTKQDRRAYWDDVQTNEQNFGLLDFVSYTDDHQIMVIDGKKDDWTPNDNFIETDNIKMSVKKDAAFIYILLESNNKVNLIDDRVLISFDITPKSGSNSYTSHDGKNTYNFSEAVDFVLELNGYNDTELFTQEYYDKFAFMYRNYPDVLIDGQRVKGADSPNSSIFNSIKLLIEVTLNLPDRNETINTIYDTTGKLLFGSTDKKSPQYSSISDFYLTPSIAEIRIAYGLLNFRDPSSKLIEDDFYASGWYSDLNIDSISIGLTEGSNTVFKKYSWDNWETVMYKEQLKESYYMMKDYFADVLNFIKSDVVNKITSKLEDAKKTKN
ncbi:L domain-like protein [Anaeromyces robustus]|uniref:L domain-like protein n=1 Tax=Anaeromyces robustus TaxID=1754192 RepID=A0A1Y1WYS2_9FUNG|nr:L domain-like protein [Anaeromyces robustus]|eukprot:ORX78336.1 L domain-like protein [Anaeromyces robustus]